MQDDRGGRTVHGNASSDGSSRRYNPNPTLTPDMVPGFRFDRSDVWASPPPAMVVENWVKDPAAGQTQTTFVCLTLHLLRDRAEALSSAKKLFGATLNDEIRAISTPTSG